VNQTNDPGAGKRLVTSADIPMSLKARYIGTGFVMGVISGPTIHKTVARIAPRFSELLDKLTGHAESVVETGADMLAQARDLLRKDGSAKSDAKTDVKFKKVSKPKAKAHDHAHDHDHPHDDHDH